MTRRPLFTPPRAPLGTRNPERHTMQNLILLIIIVGSLVIGMVIGIKMRNRKK